MESFGHNYNSENKKTYIYSRYVVYKYINSQIFSYIGVLKYTMLQVVKYGPCWGDMGSLSHFVISCTFSRGKNLHQTSSYCTSLWAYFLDYKYYPLLICIYSTYYHH